MNSSPFRLYPRMRSKLWQHLVVDLCDAPKAALEDTQIPEALNAFEWASTGPPRVTTAELQSLRAGLRQLATEYGYQYGAGPEVPGVARGTGAPLDVAMARYLFENMRLTANEAAQPGVWMFLGVYLAPELVRWRFPGDAGTNRVRFGPKLVRNALSRVWWRAQILRDERHADPYWLLSALGEDEQVQLMERTNIAGDRRVSLAFARGLVSHFDRAVHHGRMDVMRDTMRRLLRWRAWASLDGLDDTTLDAAVRHLFHESLRALGQTPTTSTPPMVTAPSPPPYTTARPPPATPVFAREGTTRTLGIDARSAPEPVAPATSPGSPPAPSTLASGTAPTNLARQTAEEASAALQELAKKLRNATIVAPAVQRPAEQTVVASPTVQQRARLHQLSRSLPEEVLVQALARRNIQVDDSEIRTTVASEAGFSWRDLLPAIGAAQAEAFLAVQQTNVEDNPRSSLLAWLLLREPTPDELAALEPESANPEPVADAPLRGPPVPADPSGWPESAPVDDPTTRRLPYDLPLPTVPSRCVLVVQRMKIHTVREALAVTRKRLEGTQGVGPQKIDSFMAWQAELAELVAPRRGPGAELAYPAPPSELPIPDSELPRVRSVADKLGLTNIEAVLAVDVQALANVDGVGTSTAKAFAVWQTQLRKLLLRLAPPARGGASDARPEPVAAPTNAPPDAAETASEPAPAPAALELSKPVEAPSHAKELGSAGEQPRSEVDFLLERLQRHARPVHQREIGRWLMLHEGRDVSTIDAKTIQAYAVRAERRLMGHPLAIRVDQGSFQHRATLELTPADEAAMISCCLERLDGETGPISTRTLVAELSSAGFNTAGLNHYVLKDLLSRRPEIRALRKTHVAWRATYSEAGVQLGDRIVELLKRAQGPMTAAAVHAALPTDLGYALSSVHQALINGGFAKPATHGDGYELADEEG